MRFLIAPNPFKGSLTAPQAARAMAAGVRDALPRARVDLMPMADGGPGTLAALASLRGARPRRARAVSALGRPLRAAWLMLPGRVAVIESAQAVGLERHGPSPANALAAHSAGLGQLLAAAARAGAREAWVGLGGSACTDGGTGMARALGWRFEDAQGRELPLGGRHLARLARMVPPAFDALCGLRVRVLCDVANPLAGPRGAACVYAPQKGAGPAGVRALDRGLARLARLMGPCALKPGAGAAGGLGAGLARFCGASLEPGAPALFALRGLAPRLEQADWVLTGEGRLDAQSMEGKLPVALARLARRHKRPCAVFAGEVDCAARTLKAQGFARAIALSEGGDRAAAMARAKPLLRRRVMAFCAALKK